MSRTANKFKVAARLFNLMLCVLLLVLPSPAAKAITRSENRVGGSPVFSSDFASQESAKPIAGSGENAACGYDFASGTHKYLYAQDNPVMGVDPSGHGLVTLSVSMAIRGTIAGVSLGSISAAYTYAKTGSAMAAAQSGLTTYSAVFLGTICPIGGIAIGGASILSLGTQAWANGGISGADAAEITTMIAASIALHATFVRYGPGLSNLGDGPETSAPIRYSNGQLANLKNLFNFVITDRGRAIIGPQDQSHVELSRGETVLAAGQVKIINGVVKVINNNSGHYRPTGPLPGIFAIRSLTVRGLDTSSAQYVDKSFILSRPIQIQGLDEWGKVVTTAGTSLSGNAADDNGN